MLNKPTIVEKEYYAVPADRLGNVTKTERVLGAATAIAATVAPAMFSIASAVNTPETVQTVGVGVLGAVVMPTLVRIAHGAWEKGKGLWNYWQLLGAANKYSKIENKINRLDRKSKFIDTRSDREELDRNLTATQRAIQRYENRLIRAGFRSAPESRIENLGLKVDKPETRVSSQTGSLRRDISSTTTARVPRSILNPQPVLIKPESRISRRVVGSTNAGSNRPVSRAKSGSLEKPESITRRTSTRSK